MRVDLEKLYINCLHIIDNSVSCYPCSTYIYVSNPCTNSLYVCIFICVQCHTNPLASPQPRPRPWITKYRPFARSHLHAPAQKINPNTPRNTYTQKYFHGAIMSMTSCCFILPLYACVWFEWKKKRAIFAFCKECKCVFVFPPEPTCSCHPIKSNRDFNLMCVRSSVRR